MLQETLKRSQTHWYVCTLCMLHGLLVDALMPLCCFIYTLIPLGLGAFRFGSQRAVCTPQAVRPLDCGRGALTLGSWCRADSMLWAKSGIPNDPDQASHSWPARDEQMHALLRPLKHCGWMRWP